VIVFRDPERAALTQHKLEMQASLELENFWDRAFEDCPDPDRALNNLERWLNASSNSGTLMAHLAESPSLARLLILLLGASQSVANALIQNPELASIVTDPGQVSVLPDVNAIIAEGQSLLSASVSYQHKLDRLRFLKQRWRIPIIVNDLAGSWVPPVIWRAISDLADAILTLLREVVWTEYATRKGIDAPCPVTIVAFGKLGGHELNYSSDVDLVYVLNDDASDLETHAARYCELLSRALSDQMGRGSLYRVDLRLRPYGGAGAMTPTMKAVESYYRSHAELWEQQALIRSRPVSGNPEIWPRWRALVEAHCFRKQTSEFTVAEIVANRERIEEHSDPEDLKRGPGGIRDVEFVTQLLQMLHGFTYPKITVPATVEALHAIAEAGLLKTEDAESLVQSYTFLRQLEHRCQLVDDQQTHSLPSTPEGREHVSRLMAYTGWDALEADLAFHRRRVRNIYEMIVTGKVKEAGPRDAVSKRLPDSNRQPILLWFDRVPESEEFYRSLNDNEHSLARVLKISETAPALLQDLSRDLSTTEAVISGEIEEATEYKIPEFQADKAAQFARHAVHQWLRIVTSWSLNPETEVGIQLAALYDKVIGSVAKGVGASFDIIGLGSYGLNEPSVSSDLDLFFLLPDDAPHAAAEVQAQQFVAAMDQLKRHGWHGAVDLRLRPEGGKGLLVRSHSGLQTYELERMELWERFALGQARHVYGDHNSMKVALKTAYALPLTPERLKELVAMKHRIETERVKPQHQKRDVKLGLGGVSDIEWFVHLHEMRYPTALEVGKHTTIHERMRRMNQAGLINALEYEEMLKAHQYLVKLRNLLSLLAFTPDIVPENPDKLERLAYAMGFASGYDLQRIHEEKIDAVRTIYLEGLERLGV
jgi:glutamate-ammonia-ligase adenylyltransferase